MSSSQKLKELCLNEGASLAGIADLSAFKAGRHTIPEDLLRPYSAAVSIALRLDDDIVNAITDRPTAEYADHYRLINSSLDRIAGALVRYMDEKGFSAMPVPASKIIDEEDLLGSISHKAVARMAGIGWQGKSLLIVSPQYGPRIRLATVLTDMPLEFDRPARNRCGKCTKCSEACPVSAIKNVSTEDLYESRDAALHFSRCAERTLENMKMPGIGGRICGVCVKACPFGKPAK